MWLGFLKLIPLSPCADSGECQGAGFLRTSRLVFAFDYATNTRGRECWCFSQYFGSCFAIAGWHSLRKQSRADLATHSWNMFHPYRPPHHDQHSAVRNSLLPRFFISNFFLSIILWYSVLSSQQGNHLLILSDEPLRTVAQLGHLYGKNFM